MRPQSQKIIAIHASHLSYQLAHYCMKNSDRPFCVVVKNNSQVTQVSDEIRTFLTESHRDRVLTLPDWETLPYDSVNTHRHITAIRIRTLYHLTQRQNPILIVSLTAFSQQFIPRDSVINQCFICRVGDTMTVNTFRSLMLEKGYDEVPEVSDTGQFAIRGAVLDVILSEHNALGFRIELFDDEIDSIRRLDVTTNRSDTRIPSIEILPSREYLNVQPDSAQIENTLPHCPAHLQPDLSKLLRHPSHINGVEYYLPFLHNRLNHLEHYIPKNTHFITPENLDAIWSREWEAIETAFNLQLNQNRPVAIPSSLYINPIQYLSEKTVHTYKIEASDQMRDNPTVLPNLVSHPKEKHTYASLNRFIQTQSQVILFAHNRSRSENLHQSLQSDGINVAMSAENKPAQEKTIQIRTAPLRQGFICHDKKTAYISENDLIGRIINHHQTVSKPRIDQMIESWDVGTIIVHRDYGIGKFLEFRSIERDGLINDFLVLEFADGDKLFVTTQQFHLLSRYVGPKVKTITLWIK